MIITKWSDKKMALDRPSENGRKREGARERRPQMTSTRSPSQQNVAAERRFKPQAKWNLEKLASISRERARATSPDRRHVARKGSARARAR